MMTMMIGFGLKDLGLGPTDTAAPSAEPAPLAGPKALKQDSPLARAAYFVMSGTPAVVVDSPPGAGKTTLVTELVAMLMARMNLKVVVACPTRRGAEDIAQRIAAELGPDSTGRPQVILDVYGLEATHGVGTGQTAAPDSPVVRTVASCKKSPPECDLMVIDEAAQVTFADAADAAANADQVLLVGDPGQIGPVVTANMSVFEGLRTNPAVGAPEVFRRIPGTEVLSLPSTYRLGQETVDVIAPLYSFGFASSRPDRYLTDEHGERVSEIIPVQLEAASAFDAVETMVAVADLAHGLVGCQLVEELADGTSAARPLAERDIAVVVAHNAQVTKVRAILDSRGAQGIMVGTADKMQGGQWHAVVALDPLVGYTVASPHQLSTGRLCVMASRHMTSLLWCFEEGWEDALLDPELDQEASTLGRRVRRSLTGSA